MPVDEGGEQRHGGAPRVELVGGVGGQADLLEEVGRAVVEAGAGENLAAKATQAISVRRRSTPRKQSSSWYPRRAAPRVRWCG